MIERATELAYNLERNLYARLAVASGIATLAISGAAEAKTPDSLHAHTPEHLEQISQLPGYHIGLNDRAKIDLKNSAVVVENDSQALYDILTPYNQCSGNVVRYRGHRYVSLDAHCEESVTNNNGGNIGPHDFPGGQSGALDFIKTTFLKAFTEETNTPLGQEEEIAKATGIDVSTRGVDSALLRVKSVPVPVNKGGFAPASFNHHTALPYMESPDLVPGQEVSLYSSPASNARPVSEIGRYLGTASQFYYDNSELKSVTDYAVVTYPKTEAQDAGYWGASGSKFAALATKNDSTTGMHGKVVFSSGGLSRRFSLRDVDNPYADGVTVQDEKEWIEGVEENTRVKVGKDAVILLYSDPSVADRRDLADNFNNYLTKG